MAVVNPNKYIRSTLVTALQSATGQPFFDTGIPIDLQPLPTLYGVVNNQTKNRFAVSKQNHEWLCSVTMELCAVQEKGFNSTVEVDDLEGVVLTSMEAIAVPGFRLGLIRLVDSIPSPIETATQTIDRTILVYELWLNKAMS